MKFAILAPGGIAESMAKAVSGIEGIERYAVASRSIERAVKFAEKWNFEKAYGSYEEMLEDPLVELVYVASPHSHHYQHAKMCLEHGKHVLVEKAFTVNARQAEILVRMAREKGLLLAEAMWTRYMPAGKMLDDLLESGVIGNVTSLTATFGFALPHVERLQNPELAGGALLDLGIYSITLVLMACKSEIKDVSTTAVLSPKGVDWTNSITLTFENGVMAVLHSSMLAHTDCQGVIYGDKGYIEVQDLNNWSELRVFGPDRKMTACYKAPEQINGYEYEVISCMKAIASGKVECDEMTHSETLRVMKLMDDVRAVWGMYLPCEDI